MPAVALTMGNVHYEKVGPDDGRPVLLIHGYAMGGSLWRPLTERLATRGCNASRRHGRSAPIPSRWTSVRSSRSRQSRRWSESCSRSCRSKTSCCSATTPEARSPRSALQPLRTRLGRRRAYGALAHGDIDDLVTEWLEPALSNSRVRDDLRRLTASLNQRTTVQAAERLPGFGKPTLIAWSQDDAFFPLEDGRRLAATLPRARLEVIREARTFSTIDRPDELAGLISEFAEDRENRRGA